MASRLSEARGPSLDDVRAVLARLAKVEPILRWRKKRYDREFETAQEWRGLQRGLYTSFEEARRDAPPTRPMTYVTDDEWYVNTLSIESFDYPVIFWLSKVLPTAQRLFDFGGHVGVHFYNYRRYLTFPSALRWIVSEQPHVVRFAESLHPEHRSEGLSFVTDWADADGSDIFLAAGCIQYLERPLAEHLRGLKELPRHLLLNKVPLYERETKVTLQNTGRSITPLWLYKRGPFIDSFKTLGYRVVDEWNCPRRGIEIPFHSVRTIKAFTGLYLTRDDAAP